MQKRKLKWANIVGIMVFACALVLNIQTSLDGKMTIFQSGIAQTGGTGSSGTGSGSGSEGEPPGYERKTESTEDIETTEETDWGTVCVTRGRKHTVTCEGVGSISCTPSSTWLTGPTYSEGCTQPE